MAGSIGCTRQSIPKIRSNHQHPLHSKLPRLQFADGAALSTWGVAETNFGGGCSEGAGID